MSDRIEKRALVAVVGAVLAAASVAGVSHAQVRAPVERAQAGDQVRALEDLSAFRRSAGADVAIVEDPDAGGEIALTREEDPDAGGEVAEDPDAGGEVAAQSSVNDSNDRYANPDIELNLPPPAPCETLSCLLGRILN